MKTLTAVSASKVIARRPRTHVDTQQAPKNQRSMASVNRLAISLLQANQPKRAVACWRRCLEMISSMQDVDDYLLDDAIKTENVVLRTEALELPQSQDTVSPNASFIIFSKALVLPEDSKSPTIAAAIILYNLGLVHQRQATLRGDSVHIYRKALNLYHQAQKLATDTSLQHLPLFHFAVLNNMGHIYSHLYEYEHANCCLYWLLEHKPHFSSIVEINDFVLETSVNAAAMA